MSSLFLLLFSLVPSFVCAAPGPRSLQSDLTILLHNDLYGNRSTHQEAVLVISTPQKSVDAKANCAVLGERLWTPSDAGNILGYAGYSASGLPSGRFWVDNGSVQCYSVDAKQEVKLEHCANSFPALCTQRTLLSDKRTANTSARWQTSIQTGGNSITGFRDKLSFRFLGIRYAAQPQRFTYSQFYASGSDSMTLQFGAQCVQAGNIGSEDCLFLNIWTPFLPANHSNSRNLKPVMFWIHGGALTSGTGSDPTFDGGNMASRGDIVLVTINYRLGAFAFLALSDGITNGNFGLTDQIVALEALLANPKAKGKFAAAIMMSNLAGFGYAKTYSEYYTIPEEVTAAAEPLLNKTGCLGAGNQLDCLRALDAHNLGNLSSTTGPRYLVVDGTYLISKRLDLSGPESAVNVPILMGIMRDDGAAFIPYPTTTDVARALTAAYFNNVTEIVNSGLFPLPVGINATLNVFNVTARVATDGELRCLDQSTAYAGLKNRVWEEGKLWFYEFNRSYQLAGYDPNAPVCDALITPFHPYGDTNQEYFKCHCGELYYVFGNLARLGFPPRDDIDIPFSQYILDSWASFARTHDPNPDPDYLKARSFTGTLERVQKKELWEPVRTDRPAYRNLVWESGMEGFGDGRQFGELSVGLEFYAGT